MFSEMVDLNRYHDCSLNYLSWLKAVLAHSQNRLMVPVFNMTFFHHFFPEWVPRNILDPRKMKQTESIMRERIINHFLHKEVTEKKMCDLQWDPKCSVTINKFKFEYIDPVRPYLRRGSAFDVSVRNPTVWIERIAPSFGILLRLWPHWRSSSSWTTSVEVSMVSNTVGQPRLTPISMWHSLVTTCRCGERVDEHQLKMIQ